MARMRPARPTDTLDTLIGFTGFFGVVFLGVTILCEVTGRPALGFALTLLAFVAAVAVLVRRRAALARHTSGVAAGGGEGQLASSSPPRSATEVRRSVGPAASGADTRHR